MAIISKTKLFLSALGLALVQANECVNLYTIVFKHHEVVHPKDVGDIYNAYCKRNMKVGSMKSMDELCAPLVKKINAKMVWVPPTEKVTPELACMKLEDIQDKYFEFAAEAQARLKEQEANEKDMKKLKDHAYAIKDALVKETKKIVTDMEKSFTEKLVEKLTARAETLIAEEAIKTGPEAIMQHIKESTETGLRAFTTKLSQRIEEGTQTWYNKAKAEAEATRKAKADAQIQKMKGEKEGEKKEL